MPIGPPPYLPEPKSGCRPVPAPIELMIVRELRATGSLSTRWFQALLRGKTRHFLALGSGWPLDSAAAPAIVATTTSSAIIRGHMAREGRPRRGHLSRRRSRPINSGMRIAAALIVTLALALPAAAQGESLLPPKGKVFAGVTGGYSVASFANETGAHPA